MEITQPADEGGGGTVTSVSVVTTNGFAGTVADPTTTPAITLTTTAAGMLAGVGGVLTARTITGTESQITVTNGDGQVGNPTLSMDASYSPSLITVADESADTSCSPLFVTAPTGNLQPKTNSNWTFDSLNTIMTFGSTSGLGTLRISKSIVTPGTGQNAVLIDPTYTSDTGAISSLNGILNQPIFRSTGSGTIGTATTIFQKTYASLAKATNATVGISTLDGMRINMALTGANNLGRITSFIGFNLISPNNEGTGVTDVVVGQAYGLSIANQGTPTGNAGLVVSQAAGMTIVDQSGATNNTNLMLGSNGFGSGNYSIYNTSTYQNVHAGSSSFGTTTVPSDKVYILGAKTATTEPASPGCIIADSTTMSQGVGGGFLFRGKYTSGGLETTAAAVHAYKEDGVSGNFGFSLLFNTRINGGNNTEKMRLLSTGQLGIGVTAPTAMLHLKAGTATASTAPIKLTSGTLNTTAEAGAIEFLTDKLYATITTGAARKELTLNDAVLTSGRVPFATTNGRLTDDADMTFSTDTLTVTKVSSGTITSTGTVILKGYTVATLPAGTIGMTAYVTDALAPTFLAVLVGGGAVVTTCFYNGTNWVAQ